MLEITMEQNILDHLEFQVMLILPDLPKTQRLILVYCFYYKKNFKNKLIEHYVLFSMNSVNNYISKLYIQELLQKKDDEYCIHEDIILSPLDQTYQINLKVTQEEIIAPKYMELGKVKKDRQKRLKGVPEEIIEPLIEPLIEQTTNSNE